jgi:hypothetical protein
VKPSSAATCRLKYMLLKLIIIKFENNRKEEKHSTHDKAVRQTNSLSASKIFRS